MFTEDNYVTKAAYSGTLGYGISGLTAESGRRATWSVLSTVRGDEGETDGGSG